VLPWRGEVVVVVARIETLQPVVRTAHSVYVRAPVWGGDV